MKSKNMILFNTDLFFKYPDSRKSGLSNLSAYSFYRLQGTNFYFFDLSQRWVKKLEYTEIDMPFEDIFNELIVDKNISDKRKELILFNLVDLRNLGR